jgi:hypothetical protein
MPFYKIRDREGKLAHLQIASAQFLCDVFGNIFRPMLHSIDAMTEPDWCTGRSGGLEIPSRARWLVVAFGPAASSATQIHRLIIVVRAIDGVQLDLRIMNSTQYGLRDLA